MPVKDVQTEKRDPRVIVFVATLILGFLVLGGIIYWLIKPSAPRTVKLSEAQTKEQAKTYEAPAPTLPAAPPLPQATDPGPTLVSLDLKATTVRQALAEVMKQGKAN